MDNEVRKLGGRGREKITLVIFDGDQANSPDRLETARPEIRVTQILRAPAGGPTASCG